MSCLTYHEENVGEGATEIGSVDVVALLLRHVDLLTFWAVDFDSRCSNFFAHADGQGGLSVAQYSRTCPESSFHKFLSHDG